MVTWVYKNPELVSVHDGDTFTFNVDLGMNLWAKKTSVRLAHIDTPELGTQAGTIARDFAKAALQAAKEIILVSLQWDKYHRLLCEVKLDGQDLAQMMIQLGYGSPYEGGARA